MSVAKIRESEVLKQKIESRTARIGIIGLGYVGLPLTLLFSEERFAVTGFDVDKKKVGTLPLKIWSTRAQAPPPLT